MTLEIDVVWRLLVPLGWSAPVACVVGALLGWCWAWLEDLGRDDT